MTKKKKQNKTRPHGTNSFNTKQDLMKQILQAFSLSSSTSLSSAATAINSSKFSSIWGQNKKIIYLLWLMNLLNVEQKKNSLFQFL